MNYAARRDVLRDPAVTARLDADHRAIGEALDRIQANEYHHPDSFRNALLAIAHLTEIIADAFSIAAHEEAR